MNNLIDSPARAHRGGLGTATDRVLRQSALPPFQTAAPIPRHEEAPLIDIYDGRDRIGTLKRLPAGGFEAFLVRDNREVYLSECHSAAEGNALIRAAHEGSLTSAPSRRNPGAER